MNNNEGEILLAKETDINYQTAKTNIYLVVKRCFDILLGIIGCILMIPFIIIIKIVYVCNKDYSSIFFKQKRIGKNGKIFNIYKFRTMVPNADEVLKEILKQDTKEAKEYKKYKKMKNDPRITKGGRFIRKASIDELPQFINVLKGEMSLIGNRPYLEREKEEMKNYYQDIVKTKPGITGYWQTRGRSRTTFEERLKLESYYSNHISLKTDIKIFFATFKVVIEWIFK